MSVDEENLHWHIAVLRRDITADWVALANRTLDVSKRRAILDHLEMSNRALRSATARLSAGLPRTNKAAGRINVDLDDLEDQTMRPRASY